MGHARLVADVAGWVRFVSGRATNGAPCAGLHGRLNGGLDVVLVVEFGALLFVGVGVRDLEIERDARRAEYLSAGKDISGCRTSAGIGHQAADVSHHRWPMRFKPRSGYGKFGFISHVVLHVHIRLVEDDAHRAFAV